MCGGPGSPEFASLVHPDSRRRWPWQPGFAVPDLPILGLIPEGV